jgi:hypothetical protein
MAIPTSRTNHALFKSTAPADAMIDWLVTILLVSDAMVGCRRTFVLLILVDGACLVVDTSRLLAPLPPLVILIGCYIGISILRVTIIFPPFLERELRPF